MNLKLIRFHIFFLLLPNTQIFIHFLAAAKVIAFFYFTNLIVIFYKNLGCVRLKSL